MLGYLTCRPAGSVFSSRTIFALAGFAVAAWAPLVPHVKTGLALSHAALSHYILLMGTGSICGMALITALLRYFKLRTILVLALLMLNGALYICIALPSRELTAVALFCFGLGLGFLEIGGNIYASFLEEKLERVLLPQMHGCYSLGEMCALATAIVLLNLGLSFYSAILVPTLCLSLIALLSLPYVDFKPTVRTATAPSFSLPHGSVLLFALVSSLIYMVEGGMLDWSALYLMQNSALTLELASSGYIVLIVAMAVARFSGGYLIAKFSSFKVLLCSVLGCALALIGMYLSASLWLIYGYFMLLGLSIANIMPICISLAGRQEQMPALTAISAVSTCGYGALIIGPALIGYLAAHLTLSGAFFTLGLIVLALSLLIYITRKAFSLA